MVFIISLCDLMFLVEVFCHLTSGMIICIITIDRYLHITSVSQRATVKSRLKYTGILCVIMLISTVISCLHLVGIGNSQVYYPGSWCFLTTSMFTFVLLWGSLPVSNWSFRFIPMKWHLQFVMFSLFITATPSFSNAHPDFWLPCSNDMQIYLSNIVLSIGANCLFYTSSCKLKLYCLWCHIPIFSSVLPALFSFLFYRFTGRQFPSYCRVNNKQL